MMIWRMISKVVWKVIFLQTVFLTFWLIDQIEMRWEWSACYWREDFESEIPRWWMTARSIELDRWFRSWANAERQIECRCRCERARWTELKKKVWQQDEKWGFLNEISEWWTSDLKISTDQCEFISNLCTWRSMTMSMQIEFMRWVVLYSVARWVLYKMCPSLWVTW
jgi:hypothetical protein